MLFSSGLLNVEHAIWFLGALSQTVRRLADPLLARVTLIGGAIYAALGIAGGSLSTAIKTMNWLVVASILMFVSASNKTAA